MNHLGSFKLIRYKVGEPFTNTNPSTPYKYPSIPLKTLKTQKQKPNISLHLFVCSKMSLKMLTRFLTVVLAVLSVPRASAQSGSCISALVSLSPCLNYITGNTSTPSSSCCSQLASVVQAEPQCLCLVLNGNTSSLGITVNRTLALGLPAACKVQTPPISRCSANGAPSAAPTSPNSTAGKTPSVGSKTLPTESESAGIALQTPAPFIFSLLFAAAFASAF